MPENQHKTNKHKNDETTVRCPVEGCEKEVLSRGLHLHLSRSSDTDHGEQGMIPKGVSADDAKIVGTQEVEMNYPKERDAETVSRLCPYCERPFRGKHGVMIHLGQTAGRKNHPEDAAEQHEPDDFAIVHVDEKGNTVEVVEESTAMPSTERRREKESEDGSGSLDENNIQDYIQGLYDQGLDEEAKKAEDMLL